MRPPNKTDAWIMIIAPCITLLFGYWFGLNTFLSQQPTTPKDEAWNTVVFAQKQLQQAQKNYLEVK